MKAKQIARVAFRDALSGRLATIDRAKQERALLNASKCELEHVTTQVLNFLGTNEHDLDAPRVSVHFSINCSNKPRVVIRYRDAAGFKDDSLTMAFTYLLNTGFDCEGNPYESAEYMNREYLFSRGDITVKFDVYVKGDSATCRRVVVGQETITRDKYAIECD